MKSFGEACHEVAVKYGLGKTLVTGHKASYFQEASEIMVAALREAIEKGFEDELQVIQNPADYFYQDVQQARTIVNTSKKILSLIDSTLPKNT